jgi:hypothetical protein
LTPRCRRSRRLGTENEEDTAQAPPPRARRLALELIAAHPEGCTEAVLAAENVPADVLIELVQSGLVIARNEYRDDEEGAVVALTSNREATTVAFLASYSSILLSLNVMVLVFAAGTLGLSAELCARGFMNERGSAFSAASISSMLCLLGVATEGENG